MSNISQDALIPHFVSFIHNFSFKSLVQLKWLGWNYKKVELLITDTGHHNGAEFGQSCGFTPSMVKQLRST